MRQPCKTMTSLEFGSAEIDHHEWYLPHCGRQRCPARRQFSIRLNRVRGNGYSKNSAAPARVLAGRGSGHLNSPRLEPIVPNSGNRLNTKSFTSLHDVARTADDKPSPCAAPWYNSYIEYLVLLSRNLPDNIKLAGEGENSR